MKLSHSQKNWLCLIVASPVILFVLFAGICRAYDTVLGNMLEDNYKNAVAAQELAEKNADTARASHCSALTALVEWKKENHQQIKGTDTTCDILLQ